MTRRAIEAGKAMLGPVMEAMKNGEDIKKDVKFGDGVVHVEGFSNVKKKQRKRKKSNGHIENTAE